MRRSDTHWICTGYVHIEVGDRHRKTVYTDQNEGKSYRLDIYEQPTQLTATEILMNLENLVTHPITHPPLLRSETL